MLTLRDPQGKEVGHAEPAATDSNPSLRYVAPEAGTYWPRFQDRFRS